MKELLKLGFDGFEVYQVLSDQQILTQYPVMDGQNNLGILDDHAQKRCDPQPEHSTVAAHGDGLRRANDVAGAHGGGQRGGERLHRRDSAVAGFFFIKELANGVFHGIAKALKLHEAAAHGEVQTAYEYAGQQNVKPSHIVECAGYKFIQPGIVDCFHMVFPQCFFQIKKTAPMRCGLCSAKKL